MFFQLIAGLGVFFYSSKALVLLIFLEVLCFFVIYSSIVSSGVLIFSLVGATLSTVIMIIFFISLSKKFSVDLSQASLF